MDDEKQDIANFIGLNLDDVRTFKIGEKIHFDALALCKVLKIKNPTVALRKIPEGNKSNSPAAKKFNDWIFDRVVPEIVETGGYNIGKKNVH